MLHTFENVALFYEGHSRRHSLCIGRCQKILRRLIAALHGPKDLGAAEKYGVHVLFFEDPREEHHVCTVHHTLVLVFFFWCHALSSRVSSCALFTCEDWSQTVEHSLRDGKSVRRGSLGFYRYSSRLYCRRFRCLLVLSQV